MIDNLPAEELGIFIPVEVYANNKLSNEVKYLFGLVASSNHNHNKYRPYTMWIPPIMVNTQELSIEDKLIFGYAKILYKYQDTHYISDVGLANLSNINFLQVQECLKQLIKGGFIIEKQIKNKKILTVDIKYCLEEEILTIN
jgi:hypothetical protein